MATPAWTRTEVPGFGYLHTATLTTADFTSESFSLPGASDRTVQFGDATWGGATAELQGSLDNVTFLPLTDAQGNAISKTANALEVVEENPIYIRAKLTTVGVGATVPVLVFSRQGRP